MFLLNGLLRSLIAPPVYGYLFYDSIFNVKAPLSLKDPNFPVESDYAKYFDSSTESYEGKITKPGDLKTSLLPFMQKIGAREDIIFLEHPEIAGCQARGTNLFRSAQAIVTVNEDFYFVDPEACRWVCKHEITHITENHVFYDILIATIVTLISAIFITSTLPILLAIVIDIAIMLTVKIIASQIFERRADNKALEHATDAELLGARRFFIAHMENIKESRTTGWKKFLYTDEGEDSKRGDLRFPFFHPTFSSRLYKVENLIEERKITFDDDKENAKIETLRNHLKESAFVNQEKRRAAAFL